MGTIYYYVSISKSFKINNEVKQKCALAQTLFGIFFLMLLKNVGKQK